MRALQLEVCCLVCVLIVFVCLSTGVFTCTFARLRVFVLTFCSYFTVQLDLAPSCWVLRFQNLNREALLLLPLLSKCIIKKLTALSLSRTIKSSKCCFEGNYVSDHRNLLHSREAQACGQAADDKCVPFFTVV